MVAVRVFRVLGDRVEVEILASQGDLVTVNKERLAVELSSEGR